MKSWNLSETQPQFERIRRLPDESVPKNLLILLVLAFGYWLCAQLGMVIVLITANIFTRISGTSLQELSETPGFFTLELFLTLCSIAVAALICKLIERRTFRTMGITKHRCLPDYAVGMVTGFAMFSAVIGMAHAAGAVRVSEGVTEERNLPLMLLMFAGWMIQGFSEEFSFRGFMMMSAGTHHKPWTAILFSSVLFGAAHIGNTGSTLTGVLNVALFGVVMSLYMLRTDSIWGPAALHTVWNWAQGSFFGLKVSGLDVRQSVLHFEQVKGHEWMNGGTFGLEGGLGTTIILVVAAAVLFFLIPQRTADYPKYDDTASPQNEA